MSRSERVSRIVPVLAALLAAASLAGCSSDSRVLARVGDRVITAGEFRELAQVAAARNFMPPDSAKQRLLDNIIQRELLLVAAKAHPAMPDSELARKRDDIEQETLSRALVQQLALGEVGVSDAEVRAFYAMRGTATHCQVVFTPDAPSARAARSALDQGEDFAAVAARFDPSGMLPPGGDLGFIQPGMLVSPVDQIVRNAPVGSVTGPLEAAGQGWFIIRIVAREPRQQGPLAAEGPELRGMLSQRKQRAFTLRRYTELRDEYRLETDANGVNLFFERFGLPQQVLGMGGQTEPPRLTPAEGATVVGTWDGGPGFRGSYTLAEAAADLGRQRGGRIDGSQTRAFEQWVRNRLLQRVAVLEARRRHLHEEPDIARHLRESLNNEILQSIYQAEIVDKAEPTEAEVRDAYQRNLVAFSELRSARLQYMTLPDSAAAARTVERVRMAPSLREAVMLASHGMEVQEENVTYPTRDRLWQMLQGSLLQEPVGATLGPYHVESGWRIVQLAGRDVRVTPYESLDDASRAGLRREAVGVASERRLAAYTDSLRRAVPVTVDQAVFKRLSWPMPAGPQLLPG